MAQPKQGFIRTTLVGGIIFLLPLVLVALILQHGFQLASSLAKPVMTLFPAVLGDRVVMADLAGAVLLFLLAFAAGLFARTSAGRRTLQWFENSMVGALPHFNFARGIAASAGTAGQTVEVVLVPTDAGLCLGFVFDPSDGPWVAVFVPGAPDWTSGSLAFAKIETIRAAGISFAQAIRILKRLGEGSSSLAAGLADADPGGPLRS